MLNLVSVAVRHYEQRQAEYVNNLRRACLRHITIPHRFACVTDDATGFDREVEAIPITKWAFGWWLKLYLFSPGLFPNGERVVYFDLDTLLLGNLDDLARYNGPLAGLGSARDNRKCSSGVMAWEAGAYSDVWLDWLAANSPVLGSGDDEWTFERKYPGAVRLQTLFPGFYSYKFHKCRNGPPPDARLVFFTRQPKCHNAAPWAQQAWSNGGLLA